MVTDLEPGGDHRAGSLPGVLVHASIVGGRRGVPAAEFVDCSFRSHRRLIGFRQGGCRRLDSMKRILGKKTMLTTAVGASFMGAMLVACSRRDALRPLPKLGLERTRTVRHPDRPPRPGHLMFRRPIRTERTPPTAATRRRMARRRSRSRSPWRATSITAVTVAGRIGNGRGPALPGACSRARSLQKSSARSCVPPEFQHGRGSSLTSNGFNTALDTIRTEAQS